eukprot:3760899-Pleurochrysis_carterae.AAC.3
MLRLYYLATWLLGLGLGRGLCGAQREHREHHPPRLCPVELEDDRARRAGARLPADGDGRPGGESVVPALLLGRRRHVDAQLGLTLAQLVGERVARAQRRQHRVHQQLEPAHRARMGVVGLQRVEVLLGKLVPHRQLADVLHTNREVRDSRVGARTAL